MHGCCPRGGACFLDAASCGPYAGRVEIKEALAVLAAFERFGVEYALVGAAAMAFHGIVRATEDLDVFIPHDAANVERLKDALRDVYAGDPNVDEIHAEELLGEYPALRYYPPAGALYLDVLTRLGEFARFEDLRVESRDIGGVRIRLATPATLFWMKKGTVRPKDRQDAAALAERFGLTDEPE